MKIYLAGPMDYVDKETQCGWRRQCHEYFDDIYGNVKLLDPTRRTHEDDLSEREILTLDMWDVTQSDLLLVDAREFNAPSFGTACEVFYASYVLKKPVIGWYNEENKPTKRRIFQNALFTRQFESLDDALQHIGSYYSEY